MDLLAPVTDDRSVGRGLYNGNISSMLVNIPKLGDAHLYGYSYDQLNRLTAMNAYTGLNTGNNSFVPVGSTNYKERVSYDGNGNILSYLRNRAGVGVDTSMDKLSYTYEYDGDGFLVKNRLKQVSDAVVSTPAGTGDLPTGQVSDNYGYDAIGNLIKDESEGIASGGIEWNVYGKISQITKTNGGVTTVIKYTYDATGNRIGKWVQVGAGTPKQTAYVRDASGNVMAIYEKGNSEVNGGLLSQIEVPLYGSLRLGVWRPDREVETTGWEIFDTDPMTGTGGGIAGGWERGRVQFELSNHLGNVLVTISDARTAVDDGTYQVLTACPTCLPGFACLPCYDVYIKQNSTPDGVVDYYLPQVLTANDYYPFGMGMPGRKYAEGNYRYGFNGKEKDSDINSLTAYDYGFRIYNPAIGRFLSVDPLTQSYPWYTPYQFSGNKPIRYIDLDGLEEKDPWDMLMQGKGDPIQNMGWIFKDFFITPQKPTKSSNAADFFHRNINPVGVLVHNGYTVTTGKDMITGENSSRVDAATNLVTLYILHKSFNIVGGTMTTPAAQMEGQLMSNSLSAGGKPGMQKPAVQITNEQKEEIASFVKQGSANSTVTTANSNTVIAATEQRALAGGRKLTNLSTLCFVAGTKVLTKDGLKNIDDVIIGDSVWAFNDLNYEKQIKKVVSLSKNVVQRIIRLEIGGEEVWTTPEHPFWIDNNWKNAGNIQIGDSVLLFSGQKQKVQEILIKDSVVSVYNFTVSDFHSYYVSELNILVHNNCPEFARNVNYKGFSAGKLKTHFEKHGIEFGQITQNDYLSLAKKFVSESGETIQEKVMGNFYVKYDKATRRTLISHIKDREIRTFYKADDRTADPFEAAVKLAQELGAPKQ